jgi:hypothetical protein
MSKRHYVVFPNGAPFPGTCVACRSNIELHDLGADLLSGGNAMLCRQCVMDLAAFNGYAPEAPLLARIAELEQELVSRETTIANIPSNVEELINGIRSNVTDFILTISGGSDDSSSVPVQKPSGSNTGASKSGKAKGSNTKARNEPVVVKGTDDVPTAPNSDS